MDDADQPKHKKTKSSSSDRPPWEFTLAKLGAMNNVNLSDMSLDMLGMYLYEKALRSACIRSVPKSSNVKADPLSSTVNIESTIISIFGDLVPRLQTFLTEIASSANALEMSIVAETAVGDIGELAKIFHRIRDGKRKNALYDLSVLQDHSLFGQKYDYIEHNFDTLPSLLPAYMAAIDGLKADDEWGLCPKEWYSTVSTRRVQAE